MAAPSLTWKQVLALRPCACGCGQEAPVAKRTSTRAGVVRGQRLRFVSGHNRRGTTDLTRYAVVDRGAISPCWEWTGPVNAKGYGYCQVGGVRKGAYRATYEAAHGPQPRSLHIDHLCANKLCVNPSHLEAVTPRENERRKRARLAAPADWPITEAAKSEAA